MGHIEIRALRLLWVALIAVLAACNETLEPRNPYIGEMLPDGWIADQRGGEPLLLWVLTTDDCLECQRLDRYVRRLLFEHSEMVSVGVLHIGRDDERSIVSAFLRGVRVSVPIHTVSPARFLESQQANWRTPLLILLEDAEVLWWFSEGVGRSAETLVEEVLQILSARTT